MQTSSIRSLFSLGRHGLIGQLGARLGGACRLTVQVSSSTGPVAQAHVPFTLRSSPISDTVKIIRPRASPWPYIIKKKAAAALRMKQRSEVSAAKLVLVIKAKTSAAKARQQARKLAAKVKAALTASSAVAKLQQRIMARASVAKRDAAKAKMVAAAKSLAARVKAEIIAKRLQARAARVQVSFNIFYLVVVAEKRFSDQIGRLLQRDV